MNLIITLLVFLSITAFSQSRIDIIKERDLYRIYKVKTEIIASGNGYKTVTNFDTEGKKTKSLGYYNNSEINITNYTYDNNGNMTEEAYLGYESGDMMVTIFFYDENGNVIKTKDGNVLPEYEHTAEFQEYTYDDNGTINTIKYTYYNNTGYETRVTEYYNIYENGLLLSHEPKCAADEQSVEMFSYLYTGNLLTSEEISSRNCKSNTLSLVSKKNYRYYENGLIKKTISKASYEEGNYSANYSYEFYK